MGHTLSRNCLVSSFIAVSASALLLASAGTFAANTTQGVDSMDKVGAFKIQKFKEVDKNRDNTVVWKELQAAFSDELGKAGWDENKTLQEADENKDRKLTRSEYAVFITNLAAEPAHAQSAQSQRKNPDTQAQQRAASASPKQTAQQEQNQSVRDNRSTSAAPVPVVTTVIAITPVPAPTPAIPVANVMDRDVVNLEGEQVGDVEKVVMRKDGTEAGLVVGLGGFMGLGEKQIFVELDQVQINEDKIVWNTAFDIEILEDLPEYNEQDFVNISQESLG